jgi:hypothetical protein
MLVFGAGCSNQRRVNALIGLNAIEASGRLRRKAKRIMERGEWPRRSALPGDFPAKRRWIASYGGEMRDGRPLGGKSEAFFLSVLPSNGNTRPRQGVAGQVRLAENRWMRRQASSSASSEVA